MKQTIHRSRGWALLTAVVLTALLFTGISEAETPPSLSISHLPRLAEDGQFERVLNRLKKDPLGQEDPRALSLIKDLERFQRHAADQSDQREEAYHVALEGMSKLKEDGDLEEALLRAVEAQGLSDDPSVMVNNPQVQQLSRRADAAARAAAKVGDWVETLNLYRLLDLLHEESYRYRDKMRDAARHVRVLRLYAPVQLQKLYEQRSQRRDTEVPFTFKAGSETWEDRLQGVKLSMLRQTLAQISRRHVNDVGYAQLLDSSMDAMTVLAETIGLEQIFPALKDPHRRAKFSEGIASLHHELTQLDKPMSFFDAAMIFERVIELNKRTLKLPEPVLVYEMTEGAVDALDEFSAVIWPSERKHFSRNTQGKFTGVGISISIRDDQLVVVSPLEDTPAHQAGLRAGDVILTVDGEDCSAWTLDQAVRKITGPEGTVVKLGIQRIGSPELLEYPIQRAEIVIKSVRGWTRSPSGGWDFYIDPDHRIGYVRLSQFIPQTARDLDHAINQMEAEHGLDALILDLRFNPGGLLSSAVEVADRFVNRGPIVSTVGPDDQRTNTHYARPDHTHRPFPVVVLINEGSASASEIIAGCLQDYHRAFIVGARSFGKGSVQDLFPLDHGEAYLKLTTQHYQLPKGRIIHRHPDDKQWGIEPDLTVRMTTQQVADAIEFRQKVDVLRDETEQEPIEDPVDAENPIRADHIITESLDPQLETALLILKTRLVSQQIALAQRQ